MIWETALYPVPYLEAVSYMEQYVESMLSRKSPDLLWFLEHPPLYTQGTSSHGSLDYKDPSQPLPFPIYPTGRGGRTTYHGPGQRILYSMIDLKRLYSAPSVHAYIQSLQNWVVVVLDELGIKSFLANDPGVWVSNPNGSLGPLKIASFGIRIRRWVTFHGLSLNVAPNLSHFEPIFPCGAQGAVTSLQALGVDISPLEIDSLFKKNCPFL